MFEAFTIFSLRMAMLFFPFYFTYIVYDNTNISLWWSPLIYIGFFILCFIWNMFASATLFAKR